MDLNPYESPHMPPEAPPGPSRFTRYLPTAIELLVVIIIIGGLVALLLPAVSAARQAATRSRNQQNLQFPP